jgi:hypothetical protein
MAFLSRCGPVEGSGPVAARPKSTNDWNFIAANLQLKVVHACKDRFEVLLAHHKVGNAAAVNK